MVPVIVLVVEPIWNRVSAVTGRGFSTLVTPKPANCSRPLWNSPTATPGTLSRRISETTKSLSCWKSESLVSWWVGMVSIDVPFA